MSWLELIENSVLGESVRSSAQLYALLQTAHLLAMAALVGTGLVLDARLVGLIRVAVRPLLTFTDPILRTAAVVALFTGLGMFAAEATTMAANTAFQLKIILIGLLFGNAFGFQFGVRRTLDLWADAPRPPLGARFAGAVAILAWIGVVTAARLIAFV
jgi:hypothetical protein